MTILVPETQLTQTFSLNIPNATGTWLFTLVSQYSVQPVPLVKVFGNTFNATVIFTNKRYTTFSVTFPTGFGNEHKNGIYNWNIQRTGSSIQPIYNPYIVEEGLVKIITDPGGGLGMTNFDSGVIDENRVADVFFRPNY